MTTVNSSFWANIQHEWFCTEYSYISSHIFFIWVPLRNIAKFPETCVFAFCFKKYLVFAHCDICQISLLCKISSPPEYLLPLSPEPQAQRFVHGSDLKKWLKGTFHSFPKGQKNYFLISLDNSSTTLLLRPSQISLLYSRSQQSVKPRPSGRSLIILL